MIRSRRPAAVSKSSCAFSAQAYRSVRSVRPRPCRFLVYRRAWCRSWAAISAAHSGMWPARASRRNHSVAALSAELSLRLARFRSCGLLSALDGCSAACQELLDPCAALRRRRGRRAQVRQVRACLSADLSEASAPRPGSWSRGSSSRPFVRRFSRCPPRRRRLLAWRRVCVSSVFRKFWLFWHCPSTRHLAVRPGFPCSALWPGFLCLPAYCGSPGGSIAPRQARVGAGRASRDSHRPGCSGRRWR